MAVLIEAISVVIRRSTLDEKYPGGTEGYYADCPNKTFCADEHLTRIGFMVGADVKTFVEGLALYGLASPASGIATDIVVIDQNSGPTTQCDWVEAGRLPEGFSAAWLAGTGYSQIVAPDWWSLETAKTIHFYTLSEAADRLFPLGEADGIEYHLDLETGKQMEAGRLKKDAQR